MALFFVLQEEISASKLNKFLELSWKQKKSYLHFICLLETRYVYKTFKQNFRFFFLIHVLILELLETIILTLIIKYGVIPLISAFLFSRKNTFEHVLSKYELHFYLFTFMPKKKKEHFFTKI